MISPITPPPMENTKPRFFNICIEGPPPTPYEKVNWEDWLVDTFKNRTIQGVYIRALISGDFSFDKKEVATPPPELVQQWRNQWMCHFDDLHPAFGHDFQQYVIAQAAQWGWVQRGAANEAELQQRADQELEACCKWLAWESPTTAEWVNRLRAARRPEPPSLKEQALETLRSMQIDPVVINGVTVNAEVMAKYDTIRQALEALPND